MNALNVTFPTSSAAGRVSKGAKNFIGVAKNETPRTMPAYKTGKITRENVIHLFVMINYVFLLL